MSPLYNPFNLNKPPQQGSPTPPAPPTPGRKGRKKTLTLEEMMKSGNPKIRQAAKRAIKVQTAINTMNTAASTGTDLSGWLSSNPEMAQTLKDAGILNSQGGIAPVQSGQGASSPFWTKDEFKDIVTETQNFANQSGGGNRDYTNVQSRFPFTRHEEAEIKTENARYMGEEMRKARTAFSRFEQEEIKTTTLVEQAKAALKKAGQKLPSSPLSVQRAAEILLAEKAKLIENPKLAEVKTAAIQQYGETDELGNPIYQPFHLDDETQPLFDPFLQAFHRSARYKEYAGNIREQKMPWWKEQWYLRLYDVTSGYLPKIGQVADTVFSWQGDYVWQGDTPNTLNTLLSAAYNTAVYAGISARTFFHDMIGEKSWEHSVLVAQHNLNEAMKTGDLERITAAQERLATNEKVLADVQDRNKDVARAENAMRTSWTRYMQAREDVADITESAKSRQEAESLIRQSEFKKEADRKVAEDLARRTRAEGYQLVAQANELVNTDPERSVVLYEMALKTVMAAQEADAAADPLDPTWSPTWVQDPEREKIFRQEMASIEIQKGAPLSTNEIRNIKYMYTNPWLDMGSDMLFDLTNLVPAGILAAALKPILRPLRFADDIAQGTMSALRTSSKGLNSAKWTKTAKALNKTANVVDAMRIKNLPGIGYLMRDTVSTVANRRQRVVAEIFSGLTKSYRTTDDLVTGIQNIGQYVQEMRYITNKEAAVNRFREIQQLEPSLQSITFDEFRQFYELVNVEDGGIAFTQWGDMYRSATLEVEDEVRRSTERKLRQTMKFDNEEAFAVELQRKVDDILKSPQNSGWVLGQYSEKFARAYSDSHRLYKGSVLLDDSISGQISLFMRKLFGDSSEDALVQKIFREVQDKYESGARLTLSEKLDRRLLAATATRSEFTIKAAKMIANTLEVTTQISRFFIDIWSMFVLSLNPRWIVQNYMDSSVRAWLHGTNPLDNAITMTFSNYRQLVDELGRFPVDLGQSLARDGLDFSTSVSGRLVYGDWKPLPGPLGIISYFQYEVDRLKNLRSLGIEEASTEASRAFSQLFPKGSKASALANMMGGMKMNFRAMSGAMQDFNTAIEFSLRLRLFHSEYFKQLKRIEPLFKEVGLDALSPEIKGIAQQVWASSEGNPRKLAGLVESVLRQNVDKNPAAWSSILPPNFEAKLSQMTDSERGTFIASIRNDLDLLVDSIYREGRKPEAADFAKFFDGIEDDFENTVNLQMSNFRSVKEISTQFGTEGTLVPEVSEAAIKSAASEKAAIRDALEQLGKKNYLKRYDPAKSFENFSIAMSEMADIRTMKGSAKFYLKGDKGRLEVHIGEDLIRNRSRAEVRSLMHEVAIETFVHSEEQFALRSGFHSIDEFRDVFRIFIGDEGAARVANKNPEQFQMLVSEMDANPNLHKVLERTLGRPIPYEQTWKLHMASVPLDKLHGQAWFDLLEAQADKIHVPPGHTRQAAIQQSKKIVVLQRHIDSGTLTEDLTRELQDFLRMYDPARKELGQFFLFSEPGPKRLSDKARQKAWDGFYWRQAEAYDFGSDLMDRISVMVKDNPDEALTYLREFNADFYSRFLNEHGITDFVDLQKGAPPRDVIVGQGGPYTVVQFDELHGQPPITNFKISRAGKTYEVSDPVARKDLYERFLSPEKRVELLSSPRFDIDPNLPLPLDRQLYQFVQDTFQMNPEQSKAYSRMINDHIEMMVQETGQSADYFLKRMGFQRVSGHLQASDAIRQVTRAKDQEGRYILYGFGAQNSTDLIRETSVMFYDDLAMLTELNRSEKAADDLWKMNNFLEEATGEKIVQGKLTDKHRDIFASAFQRYISYGEPPNKSLKTVFERYSKWMSKVNGNSLNTQLVGDLPDDVVEMMDRMFTGTKLVTPETAKRTARVMARSAGVEFKTSQDLLDIINDATAPIKKNQKALLKTQLMKLGRPEEEVDAIVSIIEMRARAWGAANNKHPAEYLDKLNFVTSLDEMEILLKKTTESLKFREWFGDSKVLNDTGQPKIMYTGTPRGGFDTFDISKSKSDENLYGPGFYFTENPEVAGEYAIGNDSGILRDDIQLPEFLTKDQTTAFAKSIEDEIAELTSKLKRQNKGLENVENIPEADLNRIVNDPTVTPEMVTDSLQIKNLRDDLHYLKSLIGRDGRLNAEFFGLDRKISADNYFGRMLLDSGYKSPLTELPASTVMPVHLSIKNPFDLDQVYTRDEAVELLEGIDDYTALWMKNTHGIGEIKGAGIYNLLEGANRNMNKKAVNDLFKAAGYDGFTHIGGGRFTPADTRRHRVYIAFEPTQIKSVFNSGEFDVDNANILKKMGAMETELPPVPDGHVRLYRGESAPTQRKVIPEWIRQNKQALGIYDAEGRWFTNNLDNAVWYKNDADVGRIVYVDVPEEIAKANKLNKQSKDVQKFSRDLETEFFLPREWANKKVVTDLQKNTPSGWLGGFSDRGDKGRFIAVFNTGRVDVLPHELGHMFRTELPESDLRIVEGAFGLAQGEFTTLHPRFVAYNRAIDGILPDEVLNYTREEYEAWFQALKTDAQRYEKAEEMFADGFVKYLKSGKSPIPELESAFQKFKMWLTEIWNSIKSTNEFNIRMTKEIRGVYDRLFELPHGQVRPPTRYTALNEVPKDVMAKVFKSEASQQIVNNLDAAFDVWKLRYDLDGIPTDALQNFNTAKAYIKQQLDNTTGELSNQYRILMWRFEQFEDAMLDNMSKSGFITRAEKTVDDFFAPMLNEFHMDDGVKTFMRNGVHNRAIYDQVQVGIQEWRKFLTNAADEGTPYPLLTGDESKALKEWSVGAAERKAEMVNLVVNGGKYRGRELEGALTMVNRVMLDYQNRNNLDQIMKMIFPFWMFPSRSIPFWINTLATHPQIILLYHKMKKMSKSFAYQAGAVTSSGDTMPSMEGYIPIPGTDMWFNPMAPMSFRYLLDMQSYGDELFYRVRDAEEGNDESAYSFLAREFMETSPVFGFTPGPWVFWALQKKGIPVEQWSLIPQTNLIPPWYIPEFIRRSEEMMNWISPEPNWHDFLIERALYEDAAEYISNASLSDVEKKAYLGKISEAISQKGDNAIWQEKYTEYTADEKKRNAFAFMTGFYLKPFSDHQADALQIKNERKLYASSMNNSFQAHIFDTPLNEEIRYDEFRKNYRVDTPLGWLYHLYGDFSWVTDSQNRLVNDPEERAKLVAQNIDSDNKARAYFQAAQELERWKNKEMSAVPIGADYEKAVQPIIEKYYQQLNNLESKLMPPYKYFGTDKPVSIIERDIRNVWWQRMAATRPGFVEGADYEDYVAQQARWDRNMPNHAKVYAKYFKLDPRIREYIKYLDTDQPLDLDKVILSLLQETNSDGYQAWKLENDDIFTALNAAWKENYWDKYWDAVGPYDGYQRDILEARFFEQNKPPTMDVLYTWIVAKYGTRFSPEDLQEMIEYSPDKRMEVYSIEARQLQDVGEVGMTRNKIWNILSWAGPGKQKDVLLNAFLDSGGNPDDMERWYTAAGKAWDDDPDHVNTFYNQLQEAARSIGLKAPNRMQLEQFLRATQENDMLTNVLKTELGEDFQDKINLYFAKSDALPKPEFKMWRAENRDINKLVDRYFDIRDLYGKHHKIWGSYYQWKPKPALSNMGTANENIAFPSPSSTTLTSTTPSGLVQPTIRSSDVLGGSQSTPAQPSSLSFRGSPDWPFGMKDSISNQLVTEIENVSRGYGQLSSSARNYLNYLYNRNPRWRRFIARILDS